MQVCTLGRDQVASIVSGNLDSPWQQAIMTFFIMRLAGCAQT